MQLLIECNPLYVLWSFANLLDGEATWFFKLASFILTAALCQSAAYWLFNKIHHLFKAKERIWIVAFISALMRPVIFYIWLIAITQSINLATDRYLIEEWAKEFGMFNSLCGVALTAWFLLRWKSNIMEILWAKSYKGEISLPAGKVSGISKLSTVIIILLTLLLIMDVTGQSLHTLIAFGGISGLAIAFASQEIIANFFGGVMVHVNQPFYERDLIQLPSSNIEGVVEQIGWYQTSIRNIDKKLIYVPNSFFTKAFVINHSRASYRKVREVIPIRYKDLPLVPSIIQDLEMFLTKLPQVDKTEKLQVDIIGLGPYAVNIQLFFYTAYIPENEYLKLRSLILLEACNIVHRLGGRLQFYPSIVNGESEEQPAKDLIIPLKESRV